MSTSNLLLRTYLVSATIFLVAVSQSTAQHPLGGWVTRPVPGLSAGLQSVAFGNGVFVAVGDSSTVARSTNGTDWTVSSPGAFGYLARVRFLNGQFLALGSSDKLLASSDGTTWSSSTLPASGFWDIAAGNGAYVLAGALTWVSIDGVNWSRTHPMNARPTSPSFVEFETALDSVVFGNGGFFGLPTGGLTPGPFQVSRQKVFSTDGVNWTRGWSTSGSLANMPGTCELIFDGHAWLATKDWLDTGSDDRGVFTSTNDAMGPWCCTFNPSPGFDTTVALASGGGHDIWMYGNSSILRIYSSIDGIDWTLRFSTPNTLARSARAAAYGLGTFVIVGFEGAGTGFVLQSGNISGLPFIFDEPQDRAATASQSFTLSVQASGAPPITYQWFHGTNAIANATNATLTVTNVTASDSGDYQVIASNSFGSATSRVAHVTVSFLGIKSYAGVEITGVPGRTYRIEATAAVAPPTWQTLTNLVLPVTPYIWFDLESPNFPVRIYRAAELP